MAQGGRRPPHPRHEDVELETRWMHTAGEEEAAQPVKVLLREEAKDAMVAVGQAQLAVLRVPEDLWIGEHSKKHHISNVCVR